MNSIFFHLIIFNGKIPNFFQEEIIKYFTTVCMFVCLCVCVWLNKLDWQAFHGQQDAKSNMCNKLSRRMCNA